jgi:pimeloyl-ACP methyl ester carboxylesterase
VNAKPWLLVSAVIALLAACPGGRSSESSPPSFAAGRCPPDVEIQLLVPHSCGYLTVLEHRSRSDGPTLRLFVVRMPPAERPSPDPVLIVGDDIGALPDYGRYQAEAERLHRVVYVMEQRGTGHSRPGLSCPEVDRVSTEGLTERAGDPSIHSRFLAAVTACRSRLLASGIDPSDFDLAAMAADVEDLRRALGLSSWNLAAYGSMSRLALEVIREFPSHVRAAYLESPQFPQLDEPTEVALGMGLMLNGLYRACHVQRGCRSRYPDLRQLWASVIAALGARPIEARTQFGDVLVDAGSFVRGVQADLSEDPDELPRFPALIVDARNRRPDMNLTTTLATHGSLCTGYRFRCTAHFSTGVYLSVLCRDEAPFSDPSALPSASSRHPGLAQAFETNPYLAACSTWKVPPAPSAMHSPVNASVPVLMFSGQLDPFSPPQLNRNLADSLENSFVVEVPGVSHVPLVGGGCQNEIRDRWMEHPSSPPTGTDCLRRLKL